MTENEPKYINPFTDFGFKNLFGKEHTKDILIDFLNEIYADLPNINTIVDLSYGDKESTRTYKEGKTVIYDIRCKTSDNRHFIVEMQVNSQKTFLSRAIYYLCRAVSDQGEIGNDWKYDFEPVYGVYITDFRVTSDTQEVKSHSQICNLNDHKPLTDKICLSIIQLIYFNKSKEECTTGFDKWIYVLKNMATMNEMPFTAEKEIFKKVQTVSDYRRLDADKRAEYDAALKRYRDYNCTLTTAREEGLEEGLEIGRAEGRAEGANERSIMIARGMKAKGMDFDLIAELTDLSLELISTL